MRITFRILAVIPVLFIATTLAHSGGVRDKRIIMHEPEPQFHEPYSPTVLRKEAVSPSIVMNNFQQQLPGHIARAPTVSYGRPQRNPIPAGNWVPCHDNPDDLCEYEVVEETQTYFGGQGHAMQNHSGQGQFQGEVRAFVQPGRFQERVDIYSEPITQPYPAAPAPVHGYGVPANPHANMAGAYHQGSVYPPATAMPYANGY